MLHIMQCPHLLFAIITEVNCLITLHGLRATQPHMTMGHFTVTGGPISHVSGMETETSYIYGVIIIIRYIKGCQFDSLEHNEVYTNSSLFLLRPLNWYFLTANQKSMGIFILLYFCPWPLNSCYLFHMPWQHRCCVMCKLLQWSQYQNLMTWCRHQMETFSALLAICVGNSLASGEFPAQRPVTQSFDVFFDLCLNKWLRKQSWGWWFEMLSHTLWRHCNDIYYSLWWKIH